MSEQLRESPLGDRHRALGARMVPFAGWSMPIQYGGIVEEHHAVRRESGVFDVSHMMRAIVSGPQAAAAIRSMVTYDVTQLAPGRGHYSLMCDEDGGILDDPYIYCLAADRLLFVGNASNGERDFATLQEAVGNFDAGAELITQQSVMLAVQGPDAVATSRSVVGDALAEVGKRRCIETTFEGAALFVSRTGYTGEDGFEFVIDAEAGPTLWDRLLAAGAKAAALGARDTLRLEAALALYGNDISEETNPFEARLDWVVDLDDGADFRGREALLDARSYEPATVLSCIKALGRGVPRHDCAVFVRDSEQGRVTSGTFSPTLGYGIAMAYIQRHLAEPGTKVQIDVRGRPLSSEVVERPFYRGGARAQGRLVIA
ncbi:MAG: glycine cleavage system aminomethyltransferase GcvT [Dehalococcoidia bacterium]|nr:glycine cleavage system aminomethyltransferase GcvT [Dehalococcoidia bacterium]